MNPRLTPLHVVELCFICVLMVEGRSYHQAARCLGRDVTAVRDWAIRLGYPSNRKAPH